ncbi:hypothetical protein ACWD5R_40460 [Streptomyces sp. NPDC002514]|uniref:hypothetical protein n=1 Tax=unclassified Streptomyces TaxID=2593676 RepID=UPI0036A1E9A7
MIKRRTIGIAAATVVLGGIGAYGATAFAADQSPSLSPSSIQSSGSVHSGGSAADRKAMIRHCTNQLPAADRAKAKQQMEEMMSGSGMMSGSMTGGPSDHGHPGMMG